MIQIEGEIRFRNTEFSYPNRKQVRVLKGINFEISAGKSVALVGPSGCGKSTCVQLIQRFYDVDEGDISLDNHDIKEMMISLFRIFEVKKKH